MFPNVRKIALNYVPGGLAGQRVRCHVVRVLYHGSEHVHLTVTVSYKKRIRVTTVHVVTTAAQVGFHDLFSYCKA